MGYSLFSPYLIPQNPAKNKQFIQKLIIHINEVNLLADHNEQCKTIEDE